MKVELKCFATLANDESCDYKNSKTYNLVAGQTVADLIRAAGIASDSVKIAFVNSRKVDFNTVLSNGDRVGLSPAVGGM
jgi:sulfur carrier protein ThiS